MPFKLDQRRPWLFAIFLTNVRPSHLFPHTKYSRFPVLAGDWIPPSCLSNWTRGVPGFLPYFLPTSVLPTCSHTQNTADFQSWLVTGFHLHAFQIGPEASLAFCHISYQRPSFPPVPTHKIQQISSPGW